MSITYVSTYLTWLCLLSSFQMAVLLIVSTHRVSDSTDLCAARCFQGVVRSAGFRSFFLSFFSQLLNINWSCQQQLHELGLVFIVASKYHWGFYKYKRIQQLFTQRKQPTKIKHIRQLIYKRNKMNVLAKNNFSKLWHEPCKNTT